MQTSFPHELIDLDVDIEHLRQILAEIEDYRARFLNEISDLISNNNDGDDHEQVGFENMNKEDLKHGLNQFEIDYNLLYVKFSRRLFLFNI